jgi:hypothetical protein
VRRVDGTVAFGPIWDWKTADVWGYLARHRLPVNPVYAKLRRLGAPEHFLRVSHLLDGNRLEEGRVTWLRRGWPGLFTNSPSSCPASASSTDAPGFGVAGGTRVDLHYGPGVPRKRQLLSFDDLVADPAAVIRATSRRRQAPQVRTLYAAVSADVAFTAANAARRLGISQADLIEALLRLFLEQTGTKLEQPPGKT